MENISAQVIYDYSNKYGRGNELKIVILLKGDNQGSIALAHNLLFYLKIKYNNI